MIIIEMMLLVILLEKSNQRGCLKFISLAHFLSVHGFMTFFTASSEGLLN